MQNIVFFTGFSDIDECANSEDNECEQICTDTFLSYNCSCEDGYTLNNDGLTCSGMCKNM